MELLVSVPGGEALTGYPFWTTQSFADLGDPV
jgi:hypothetical protein